MGNACTNCSACKGDNGENGEILTVDNKVSSFIISNPNIIIIFIVRNETNSRISCKSIN